MTQADYEKTVAAILELFLVEGAPSAVFVFGDAERRWLRVYVLDYDHLPDDLFDAFKAAVHDVFPEMTSITVLAVEEFPDRYNAEDDFRIDCHADDVDWRNQIAAQIKRNVLQAMQSHQSPQAWSMPIPPNIMARLMKPVILVD